MIVPPRVGLVVPGPVPVRVTEICFLNSAIDRDIYPENNTS